jgi:hypothetical protein
VHAVIYLNRREGEVVYLKEKQFLLNYSESKDLIIVVPMLKRTDDKCCASSV